MPVPEIGSVKANTVGMSDGMADGKAGTKNTAILSSYEANSMQAMNMASNTSGEKNMKTLAYDDMPDVGMCGDCAKK